MKISVHPNPPLEHSLGTNQPDNREIDAAELAALWRSGQYIAPQWEPHKTGRPTFVAADFIAVQIDLERLSRERIESSAFTSSYATVIAYPEDAAARGVAMLAFQLPCTVTSWTRYSCLLRGLQTRYAGAHDKASVPTGFPIGSPSRIPTFGTGVLAGSRVGGNHLDVDAVAQLELLGTEQQSIQRNNGQYVRSSYSTEETASLTLADGTKRLLNHITPGTLVKCPLHADYRSTASVLRLNSGGLGVMCRHCKRVFGPKLLTRGYDFGHFDRVVHDIADPPSPFVWGSDTEAEKPDAAPPLVEFESIEQVTFHRTRYLPQFELRDGVTCVKSPKGTGKTECLANLVRDCRAKGRSVLLIGHRRILLQAMSDSLELDCYFDSLGVEPELLPEASTAKSSEAPDPETDDPDSAPQPEDPSEKPAPYKRREPTRHYAVSLDSLDMLDPAVNRYDIVIIDESEQVVRHLFGSTLIGKRQAVFARFQHYLRVASSVVVLDADLAMVTMTALFECNLKKETPFRFIVNEPAQTLGTTHKYTGPNQLLDKLKAEVSAGKKAYVATNSRRKAVDIESMLKKLCPSSRIVTVHANNSQTHRVQSLLKNIAYEFENNIDVLIASPSLGTGIDITFKDESGAPRTVVDHCFGIFQGNTTTHFDIDQQLMRVRHPGQVHVWVDPSSQRYETDPGVIKMELQCTVASSHALQAYSDDGEAMTVEQPLVNLWAEVTAATRASKNELADRFEQLRVANGHTVSQVMPGQQVEGGNKDMKDARNERLERRKAAILAATDIPNGRAHFLNERRDKGMALSAAESAQIDRHYLGKFYCEKVTEELIDFDDEGRARKGVEHLGWLTGELSAIRRRDLFDSRRSTVKGRQKEAAQHFDHKHRTLKRTMLGELFCSAGVYSLVTEAFDYQHVVQASQLLPFVRQLKRRRAQFEEVFGTPLRADFSEKPVQQLGALLKLVGLRLACFQTRDCNREKVRHYRVCVEEAEHALAIVRRRAAESDRSKTS